MSRSSLLGSPTLLVAAMVCLLAPLSACVVDAPTPDGAQRVVERPIQGGYYDDVDTAVVAVVKGQFYLEGICSGTLISPNMILTARHCVADVLAEHPQGGVVCGQTYFSNPHQASAHQYATDAQLGWGTSYRPVVELIVPTQETTFCGYDIALIRLADPVDPSVATPRIPRVDEALYVPTPGLPGSGEGYSAVGYGKASDARTNSSGVRRRRDGLFALCGEGNCGFVASIADTEWVGDTGVCSGDSGGPAFDLAGRVIGVASRGGQECSSPIYASVYAWGDWIKAHVIAAADAAGITPPAWAEGWPTHPDFNHPIGAACETDDECPSGVCMLGQYCTRKCADVAPCGANFFCNIADYCMLREVGEACSADEDCGSGRCFDGHCTRECYGGVWACPAGWSCDGESDMCELQPVGVGCVTDDGCDGGVCVDGLCTRACSDAASCPSGWSCEGGQCGLLPVGDACEADGDCGDGGRCDTVVGRCTRDCSATAPCPALWQCGEDGQCSLPEIGGECVADGDCAAGTSCGADGLCTRGCNDLAPCPDALTCGDDGICSVVVEPPSNPPGGCSTTAPGSPLIALLLAFVALFSRRRYGLPRGESC